MKNMTGRLSLWINAILKAKETYAAEKTNANWRDALINLSVIPIIAGLLLGIAVAFLGTFLSMIPGLEALKTLGVLAIIVLPIVFVIAAWIGSIIGAAILNFIAKLLGGQGNFLQLFYIISLCTPLLSVITLVLNVIPVVGGLIGLILDLYFMTLAIKEVHQLTTGKAVLTWLVLVIIAIIVAFVFAAAMLAALFGAGMVNPQ